jgi:hypothetical protein
MTAAPKNRSGGSDLNTNSIDKPFDFLMPDNLLQHIVEHTNPKLLSCTGIDKRTIRHSP